MATERLPRPRDPTALAKLTGDIATGQVVGAMEDGEDLAAVEPGRRDGLKGGRSRAERMAPTKRRAAARKAVKVRWSK